jgi:hypothetical protein
LNVLLDALIERSEWCARGLEAYGFGPEVRKIIFHADKPPVRFQEDK